MTDKLDKYQPQVPQAAPEKRGSMSRLHSRLASAPVPTGPPRVHIVNGTLNISSTDAAKKHRIGLLLDCSRSMDESAEGYSAGQGSLRAKAKIAHLRDACQRFVESCALHDTAVGIDTFPKVCEGPRMPMCSIAALLVSEIQRLDAVGGTPMSETLEAALESMSMTRAVLVSDGEADFPDMALAQAKRYAERRVVIDCVHVGESTAGEQLLKQIALTTGGLYIKFTDVTSFARNFAYLTPAKRSLLTQGNAASLLGAKEVK